MISKLVLNCRSDERGIHVDELSRELKLPMDRIMSVIVYVSFCLGKAFTYDVTHLLCCQVVAEDSWR